MKKPAAKAAGLGSRPDPSIRDQTPDDTESSDDDDE